MSTFHQKPKKRVLHFALFYIAFMLSPTI